MKVVAWLLMLSSLVVTGVAHMLRGLDQRARNRLITIGLALLAIGLALGAASGDL